MGAAPATFFTLLASPLPANVRLPDASCTSTQESAEKLKRRRARPAPGTAASTAVGVAAVGAGAAAGLGGAFSAATGAGAVSRTVAGDAAAEAIPVAPAALSGNSFTGVEFDRGGLRHAAQRPALMPGPPPQNPEQQQHCRNATRDRQRRQVPRLRRIGTRRMHHAGAGEKRLAGCYGARIIAGQDFRRRQAQQCGVLLQVAFGINRRPDPLVVVRLERIDDPAIQVHFVSRFLRAQSSLLALRFEAQIRAIPRTRSSIDAIAHVLRLLRVRKFGLHAPRENRRSHRVAQLAFGAKSQPQDLGRRLIHRQIALHDIQRLRGIAALEGDIAQLQQAPRHNSAGSRAPG